MTDFWTDLGNTISETVTEAAEAVGGAISTTYNNTIGTIDQNPVLDQSKYNFTSRVFPEDLTMEDNNHYMIINIAVPVLNIGPFVIDRGKNLLNAELLNEYSKVDQLRFAFGYAQLPLNPTALAGQSQLGVFRRGTRRIAQSIALHMPQSGLVYTEDNKYQELSLTQLLGDAISAIASGTEASPGGRSSTSIVDAAGQILNLVTKGGKVAGFPIIPRVQVTFATRPQRQWVFEVFMMPRTESESKTVKEIIKTLRFYAAPEISVGGLTFIPPAEFDITFYRGGNENRNLPRINTCVLERIDLDYAPGGDYSVFEADGHSVAVRMSLSFREIEILHKARIAQGF